MLHDQTGRAERSNENFKTFTSSEKELQSVSGLTRYFKRIRRRHGVSDRKKLYGDRKGYPG